MIDSISDFTLPPGIKRFEDVKKEEASREIKRTSTLGQAEFLKLMTTQLQHQDPLKPMENGEFLGQMAQFSTVTGITEMSTALSKITEGFDTQRKMQTIGLIGKDVLVNDTNAELTEDKGLRGVVDLKTASNQVQIQISNGAGDVVHIVDMGRKFSGQHTFHWDGVLDSGEKAELENYAISAVALNNSGTVSPNVKVFGQVSGVRFVKDSSEVMVELAGRGEIGLGDIERVGE